MSHYARGGLYNSRQAYADYQDKQHEEKQKAKIPAQNITNENVGKASQPKTVNKAVTTKTEPTQSDKKSSLFPGSFYPYPEHDLSKVVVGTQDTSTKTETDKGGTEDDPIQQYVDLISKGNSSVPDLMAAFKTNNEQAMKQSQTLSNNVYSKVNDLTALYKDLYNDQKTYNPLEADWAKQLLSYYGIESGEAADNARASGAADNGGNIDSYAAANAERQRLSKLNAGVNSISGMSQNRFNNMLSTLQSIGVDTTNLFGVEQKNTQAALENAGTTGNLAVSEGETQTAADLQNNQLIADLMAAVNGGTSESGEEGSNQGLVGTEGTIVRLLPAIYEEYPDASDADVISMLVNQLVEEGYTKNKDWANLLVRSALSKYHNQQGIEGPVQ